MSYRRDVSRNVDIPVLVHDAFMAYLRVLGHHSGGVTSCGCESSAGLLQEATAGWRCAMRGLCGVESVDGRREEVCAGGGSVADRVGVDSNVGDVGFDSGVGSVDTTEDRGDCSDREHRGAASVVEVKGKHYEKNRRKKQNKKQKKNRACGTEVMNGQPAWVMAKDVEKFDVDGAIRGSVKRKWIAKNDLEALEAERKAALIRAMPLSDVVRAESTRVRARAEQNMVRIEKSHAFLSATGNVPGEGSLARGDVAPDGCGFAETVVSGGASISPGSSASQAEFRAAQKTILDQQHLIAKMEKAFEKVGVTFEIADAQDKLTFTDDTHGNELMDALYPTGIAYHEVRRGGKVKMKIGPEDF